MNRELKFRIWNGFQFVTKSDTYIKTCNGSLWDYDDGVLWSADAKIQQYTGIIDKNAKEVYEGDIVRLTYKMDEHGDIWSGEYEVIYEYGSFGTKEDTFFNLSFLPCFSIEVVGNIFEKRIDNLKN